MNALQKIRAVLPYGLRLAAALCLASISGAFSHELRAQTISPQPSQCTLRGTVVDAQAKPLANTTVTIDAAGIQIQQVESNQNGEFIFALPPGNFSIHTEKEKLHANANIAVAACGDVKPVFLTLTDKSGKQTTALPEMEFSDDPNFTVAGVTDWTAVGGHGSDLILRTSEDLARETLTLKPSTPVNPEPNSTNANQAFHERSTADIAEKSGDALAAVQAYQKAVQLDPSEENYFAWGSELLLHRAVWQAVEVFRSGTRLYPQSARMLTALGTALFAGARYNEAALDLCAASDLVPLNPDPYLFMGKIEIAAPNPLPCVQEKLARFANQQPDNSMANYLYATALEKTQTPNSLQQSESFFTRAAALDPKCADAYLQLGILSARRHDDAKAISFYLKAITADPELADAHYRLAVAYDRSGQAEKAKQEFNLHQQLEQKQADATEQQRRELKQFQVLLKDRNSTASQ
jgi:tetratricopeptide (TPR) repeat protein